MDLHHPDSDRNKMADSTPQEEEPLARAWQWVAGDEANQRYAHRRAYKRFVDDSTTPSKYAPKKR
jgi:hypothetical protein